MSLGRVQPLTSERHFKYSNSVFLDSLPNIHCLDTWALWSKPVVLREKDWFVVGGMSNMSDDPFVMTTFTYNHPFSRAVQGDENEPPLYIPPWTTPFATLLSQPGLIFSFDIGGLVDPWTTYRHEMKFSEYANKVESPLGVPGVFIYTTPAQEHWKYYDEGNFMRDQRLRNRTGQEEHEDRQVFRPILPPVGEGGGGAGGTGGGGAGGTGGGGATS